MLVLELYVIFLLLDMFYENEIITINLVVF